MFTMETEGGRCGIISRTIDGPYAVLVAEQLAASGARVIVGLTSAGRVAPFLRIPGVVVADRAIRDEGTSYHYLPPYETVAGDGRLADALQREIDKIGLPLYRGTVWTTDAPYRETGVQLARHARAGVLAVEMQAASLFAFSVARGVPTGIVAHVTNAVDHHGDPFDKGERDTDRLLLEAIIAAGNALIGE
jgi:uridine phosphorylase